MNRIVITGPTGAIGMALINKCIQEGKEVLAICHRGSKRSCRIPKHPLVKIIEADMSEYENYQLFPELKYDCFYHLAWQGTFGITRNDTKVQADNIRYTISAVELADRLGCTAFIGAGSQAEYGRIEGKLTGETPAFPENSYGMAKLCAGQMSRLLCTQKKIKHIWARILSVYGPYDGEYTMIMSALKKMLRHEETLFTKGEQQWDYLYSEDAAEALLKLAIHGKDGKIYCLGSGQTAPLVKYIETMQEVAGSQGTLGIGKLAYHELQVMYLCADIRELVKDIGFTPKTSFEEGIGKTIGWLRSYEKN